MKIKRSRIYLKTYYKSSSLRLRRNHPTLTKEFNSNRHVFLYFDYEREFGGHKTAITDKHISLILDHLNEYQIRATWFTVGKIFEFYPESVKLIQKNNHEIASHSYGHIQPLYLNRRNLKLDFDKFESASRNYSKARGFHSPNGLWNIPLLRMLLENDYYYDVIGANKYKKSGITKIKVISKGSLFRLYTLGDDWPLRSACLSAEEAFQYFMKLEKQLKPGQIAGIGFHPWLLISNDNIMLGFRDFLNYLSNKKDLILLPADEIIKKFKESEK